MSSLYMPNILLYGEGPSDIQGSSSQQGALVCMTVQTLKELASELCHHGSWLAPFVDDWTSQELQAHSLAADKQEIKALVPTLKGRARGVFGSELAQFFNEAYALGKIALAKHLDLAFFFHDADFTDTDSIYRRIRAGFDHAGFEGYYSNKVGIAVGGRSPRSEKRGASECAYGWRSTSDEYVFWESNQRPLKRAYGWKPPKLATSLGADSYWLAIFKSCNLAGLVASSKSGSSSQS